MSLKENELEQTTPVEGAEEEVLEAVAEPVVEVEADVVEETQNEISEDVFVEDSEELISEEENADVEENDVQLDDEILETNESYDETVAQACEVLEEVSQKKSKAPLIVSIIVVIAIIAAVALFIFGDFGTKNYNDLVYANISGQTLSDLLEMQGVELTEFLEKYSLPEDMTEDTYIEAAEYCIPLGVYATMTGLDYATVKELLQIPDQTTPNEPKNIKEKIKSLLGLNKTVVIDENTPWGVALDEVTLGAYVGEEYFDQFKEMYGLGDDITVDTKYKQVRQTVEEAQAKMYAAMMADSENSTETQVEENTQPVDETQSVVTE